MHSVTGHEEVWERCLKFIRGNVSRQSFKTWFEPIKPLRLKDNVLTIQVPSHFVYEYLEEHYISLLKVTIHKELGKEGRLEYSVIMDENFSNYNPYTVRLPSTDKESLKNHPVSLPIDLNKGHIRNPFVIAGLKKVEVDARLNPAYSFENFVEGDCNRLARSAGYAVARKPGGTAFNPLLVYGDGGLGKTHLIQAIGIETKKNNPDLIVLYVEAEKFCHQFIEATINNSRNDFVHFYQMIDLLIIDDVHEWSAKEKTQDIFFHIFNHLHQQGKQLILSCDKPPSEIQGMEQRLLSRFKWGLSADLQRPDLETRMAILQKKVEADNIEIPEKVIEYLSYSITQNIRELQGALITLLAHSSFNKTPITMELAKKMIDKFVKNTTHEISIDFIQKVVCDYFDLPVETLKSTSRKREVVQARQLTMYFSKTMTKSSLAKIGMECGGKDHATVLHAYRTVNDLLDTDKRFRGYVDDLKKRIAIH